MKRSCLLASSIAVSMWSLVGCGGPRQQPAMMAPPVAQSMPGAPPMNGGGMNNGGMNGGGMNGGNMPVSAQSGGVYNWQDVPVNQQVGIQRAMFDQGGYQLITDNGDTIVVPFANQNLYVMRFGRANGQTYFVNEGGVPTLYLANGFGLSNAVAQGAMWYPIPANYNYTRPMYVGIAPSWGDYMGMGWYNGMSVYGGQWGYNPYGMSWMPGYYINIGGRPYYGWNGYHSYYTSHPGYYRSRVVYNTYNTAPRGTGSYRPSGGSFGNGGSRPTGSYTGGRPSGFNNGGRPSGSYTPGTRPSGGFNNGTRPSGSFGGGSTYNNGSTGYTRPSGSFGGGSSTTPTAPSTRGSFGGGSSGTYSAPPPRSSGGSFGGGSTSRPSGGSFGGGSSSRPSGSFGGGGRRR